MTSSLQIEVGKYILHHQVRYPNLLFVPIESSFLLRISVCLLVTGVPIFNSRNNVFRYHIFTRIRGKC